MRSLVRGDKLVGSVLQNGKERSAQGACARAHGDPELYKEGADLVACLHHEFS